MSILYIVSTPIGNLSDITLRALEILKTVDVIACEDTRHTKKLLSHYAITTPTLSYHQHSGEARIHHILDYLRSGKSVALVSDAGTPGISDPGQSLIAQAVAAGFSVVPLPGASAFVTALSASGIDTHHFLFLGFLPHKNGRKTLFERIKMSEESVVFYESPHRILKTLGTLANILPSSRHIIIARELTKVHEEFFRGSAQEILRRLQEKNKILGEFVVIVAPYSS